MKLVFSSLTLVCVPIFFTFPLPFYFVSLTGMSGGYNLNEPSLLCHRPPLPIAHTPHLPSPVITTLLESYGWGAPHHPCLTCLHFTSFLPSNPFLFFYSAVGHCITQQHNSIPKVKNYTAKLFKNPYYFLQNYN